MHCPRCGQKQVSPEIKFCSRCGFPLGLVSEILANGGVLPQLIDLYNKKSSIWTKKNGVMFSVFWFIFFVLIMTPLWGIMDVDELAGASAIIGVFGALMWLIAALVFLKGAPKVSPYMMNEMQQPIPNQFYQQQNLHGANPNALPPQQSIPVNTYVPPGGWKAPDTGDLQPHSVTDDTTKLLNKDK